MVPLVAVTSAIMMKDLFTVHAMKAISFNQRTIQDVQVIIIAK